MDALGVRRGGGARRLLVRARRVRVGRLRRRVRRVVLDRRRRAPQRGPRVPRRRPVRIHGAHRSTAETSCSWIAEGTSRGRLALLGRRVVQTAGRHARARRGTRRATRPRRFFRQTRRRRRGGRRGGSRGGAPCEQARGKAVPTEGARRRERERERETSASVSVRDADSDAVLVAPPPVDCRACKVGRYDVARATVPRGFVFVLGDNRGGSVDSHRGDSSQGKRRGARPRARRARRPRGTVERERRRENRASPIETETRAKHEVNRRRRFRVCCSYLS